MAWKSSPTAVTSQPKPPRARARSTCNPLTSWYSSISTWSNEAASRGPITSSRASARHISSRSSRSITPSSRLRAVYSRNSDEIASRWSETHGKCSASTSDSGSWALTVREYRSSSVPFFGNRDPRAAAWPASTRSRSSTSAASPASSTPKPGGRPRAAAWRRTSRCATEWKVPPITRDEAGTSPRARWSISREARRVNVNSRIRSDGTPSATSHATRAQSVVVLPVPAPARISNGPPRWVAAARCSSLSSSSQYRSPVSATTAMGRATLRSSPDD